MNQLASIDPAHNVASYRAAALTRIKDLMHDWSQNTLNLGRELADVAETFPVNPKRPTTRPGFMAWAKQATSLSDTQIFVLLRIHRKFGHRPVQGRLGQKVMRLLSQPDVPESARVEAMDRAEKGEHIQFRDAKKIAKAHKLPTAKDANQQAREEGRPVLARDGFIYFGTDPGRAKEGEDRRTMVYGVRKALDTLGNIQLTARQFLDYAMPHQLWTGEEAKIIKQALRWLTALDEAWDARE